MKEFPAFFLTRWSAAGIRRYPSLSRREGAIALMDIFGAPYAHYHSFDEMARWYRERGLTELWPCNEGRRGFGICGRSSGPDALAVTEAAGLEQRRQADSLVG